MDHETISVRIAPETRAELDAVAESLHRTPGDIIAEAVEEKLRLHRWQVTHIREGVRQAEAGELASEQEVDAVFARFGA